MRGFRHRAAGVVHERAGEQQQHPLAAERPSAETPWKRRRHGPMRDACDRVDHHETDIVSVAGIARTGIAEPDEQQHGNVNS